VRSIRRPPYPINQQYMQLPNTIFDFPPVFVPSLSVPYFDSLAPNRSLYTERVLAPYSALGSPSKSDILLSLRIWVRCCRRSSVVLLALVFLVVVRGEAVAKWRGKRSGGSLVQRWVGCLRAGTSADGCNARARWRLSLTRRRSTWRGS
jgi:hypothetical protein